MTIIIKKNVTRGTRPMNHFLFIYISHNIDDGPSYLSCLEHGQYCCKLVMNMSHTYDM